MMFWGLRLIAHRSPTRRIAIAAFAISVAVEVSQLYRAPWIDAIRATWWGALALGQGFLWTDIACYATGVLLAAVVDARLQDRDLAT
jgi:hypothetical protein